MSAIIDSEMEIMKRTDVRQVNQMITTFSSNNLNIRFYEFMLWD